MVDTHNHDSDSDLDDLLDEFDEQVLSQPPGAENPASAAKATDLDPQAALEQDFAHDVEQLIKDLKIEDPDAKVQFEELVKQFETTHASESAKQADPSYKAPSPQLDGVVKDTMQRLRQSGQNIDEQLKNDPSAANPEDMLAQLLSGLGDTGNGDVDMSKLLTDMLEQLLSKDVLYDPIKELNTKFPAYLAEQKLVLSADKHATYVKQYEITNQIVAVFEAADYNGDDEATREKVNGLLESLQELGNPPSDLVGDEKDFPGFGGLGGQDGLDFDLKDLPPGFEKELEEGCKQT